jgi:hypothetical protein
MRYSIRGIRDGHEGSVRDLLVLGVRRQFHAANEGSVNR